MAKRRGKKKACGKGWVTLEIRRGKKIERVCVRFVKHKKKPKGVEAKVWHDAVSVATSGLMDAI